MSLFTLHVLWPFLRIWAMAYKPERGWGFSIDGAVPPGAACETAIYTEHVEGLSLLRKILLPMRSREKYVFTEEGGGGHGGH